MAVNATRMGQVGEATKSGRDRVDNFKLEDGDEFIVYICPDSEDFRAHESTNGLCFLSVAQWSTGYQVRGGHEWKIQFPITCLSNDKSGNRELFEHPVMLDRLADRDNIPTLKNGDPDIDALLEFDPIFDLKTGHSDYADLDIPHADLKGLKRSTGFLFGVVVMGQVEEDRKGNREEVLFDDAELFPQRYYPSISVFKQITKAFSDANCDITDPDAAMFLKISRKKNNNRVEYDVSLYVPTTRKPAQISERLWNLIQTEQEPGGTLDLFGALAYSVKTPEELQAEILEQYKPKRSSRGGRGGDDRGSAIRDARRGGREEPKDEPPPTTRRRAASLDEDEKPVANPRRAAREEEPASRRGAAAPEATSRRRSEPPPDSSDEGDDDGLDDPDDMDPPAEPEPTPVRPRRQAAAEPEPKEEAPASRRTAAVAKPETKADDAPVPRRTARQEAAKADDDVPPFDDAPTPRRGGASSRMASTKVAQPVDEDGATDAFEAAVANRIGKK